MYENSDLISRCIFVSLESVVFLYYFTTTRRFYKTFYRTNSNFSTHAYKKSSLNDSSIEIELLLSTQSRQSSDPYILAMLLLLGTSLAIKLFIRLPLDIYYLTSIYKESDTQQRNTNDDDDVTPYFLADGYFDWWVNRIPRFILHTSMKIGVQVNIVRWEITVINMKARGRGERERWVRAAKGSLHVIIAIEIVAAGLQLANDETLQQIGAIWAKYLITSIPLLAYPLLYLTIKRHYAHQLALSRGLLTQEDIDGVNAAVRHTLYFFVAIGQYQVFRLVNNFVRYNDETNNYVELRLAATTSYFISEIIMLVCLCQSINMVCNTLTHHDQSIRKTIDEHQSGTHSSLMDPVYTTTKSASESSGSKWELHREEYEQRRDSHVKKSIKAMFQQ
ncbi:hypothetical protein FGO68_gene13894 [Halteria grandinella]|uniref:Uncharacterized protein n=1 Tax=Halteria grandinella TaxID=5974 RepID=A0A8J8T0I1_HALGN|nr:hypothetical protein FGO68_gene13894 [Halteria grandinella]